VDWTLEPDCATSLHKLPRDAPGRAITHYQWIHGNRAFCRCHIFAFSSPTILALGKNLFAVYRGQPITQEPTSSVTRHAGRDSSAVPSRHPISYSPVVQPLFPRILKYAQRLRVAGSAGALRSSESGRPFAAPKRRAPHLQEEKLASSAPLPYCCEIPESLKIVLFLNSALDTKLRQHRHHLSERKPGKLCGLAE